MVTSANVWDMIDSYCTTNNKCIIKFNNSKIASASASKQAEVWTWYANFAEDSVLDMMKTLGTWDMVIESNEDQAIANATSLLASGGSSITPHLFLRIIDRINNDVAIFSHHETNIFFVYHKIRF